MYQVSILIVPLLPQQCELWSSSIPGIPASSTGQNAAMRLYWFKQPCLALCYCQGNVTAYPPGSPSASVFGSLPTSSLASILLPDNTICLLLPSNLVSPFCSSCQIKPDWPSTWCLLKISHELHYPSLPASDGLCPNPWQSNHYGYPTLSLAVLMASLRLRSPPWRWKTCDKCVNFTSWSMRH